MAESGTEKIDQVKVELRGDGIQKKENQPG